MKITESVYILFYIKCHGNCIYMYLIYKVHYGALGNCIYPIFKIPWKSWK